MTYSQFLFPAYQAPVWHSPVRVRGSVARRAITTGDEADIDNRLPSQHADHPTVILQR
jgi:hypothetical protein